MKEYPLTIVVFSPELPCITCDTLTSVLVINPEFGNAFAPACPLHGFLYYGGTALDNPECHHFEQQKFLISRFVVSQYHQTGRVVLVSKVPPESIPGYRATSAAELGVSEERFARHHLDDLAWYVCYELPGGERRDCHVEWSWDYLEFALYEGGRDVTAESALTRRASREENSK